MEFILEVFTTRRSRREAHRQWPDGIEARIVSESLRTGAKVNQVAERHGLKANHLSSRVGFKVQAVDLDSKKVDASVSWEVWTVLV